MAIPKTTAVFDTFWHFAAERQNIFFRRLAGHRPPFSDDPILNNYRFTNVYRASDRTTQYLIRNVIYAEDSFSEDDILFRVLLFKLFNSIHTWKLIVTDLGEPRLSTFKYDDADKILQREISNGRPIYSPAYIMPSGKSYFGQARKHQNHLALLALLTKDRFASRATSCRSLEDLYKLLMGYPSIGSFLAYQYAIDINYSPIVNFNESDFVVAGPGAIGGITKCFQSPTADRTREVINWMFENQTDQFNKRGIAFKTLFGRALQPIDIQNIFCEVDKYARVAHPSFPDKMGRTKIKRRFVEDSSPMKLFFPPKWGIIPPAS